ncbi:MAG: hypothetical protein U9O20_04045 [Patescibacteria group bacterium]|nr:hypothetical protein [Patescibacteria group bacterium]
MSTKRNNHRHAYIKHKDLVSGAYLPTKKPLNEVAIIIAQGAINPGDAGKRRFHEATVNFGIPVFIPDYYGHSRSNGKFSPKNCAKTITDMIDFLKKGAEFYDLSKNGSTRYNFKDVLVIGYSFGAWVPWYINHFFPNKKMDRFGLISPFIDFKNQATREFPKEQSIQSFLREGRKIYKNIYRGMEDPIWDTFLFAKEKKFDPMRNLKSISENKIAIIHGEKDTVINCKKSVNLHKKLLELNPQNKKLKIFPSIAHDGDLLATQGGMTFLLNHLLGKNNY